MGSVARVYLSGCNYEIGYDLISQSTANNTSYVKFWGILHVTNSYVSWSRGTANVWGSNTTLSTRYNKGDYEVTNQYVTLYHNSDGSYSHSLGGTLSTSYTSGTAQGTFSLPTIARASQPSCITWPNTTSNVGAIGGDPFTIHMNRKSTAFTHTVRYSWYNKSGTIATDVTDNCQWSIPADFSEDIPNAATGSGTIYVDTYNGSTLIGTKSVVFYCNVVNSNPTFDCAYLDTNSTAVAITQNNQQLIQNISTLRVNITNARALNYASLSSAKVTINGVDYDATLSGSSVSIDVGVLNIAQNIDAVVTVIDSRNLTTSKTLNLQILEWQQPNAIITLNRQSNFYSETDINVDANYSSLDNKNTITIQVRYKKTSDSTYGAYETLQDNVPAVITLDNLYQWDVQVKLTDRTGAFTTYNLSVDRGMPIFYIDRLKRSIGIDCFPTQETSLEILGKTIYDMIYPIGSIYISVAATNPQTLFGGTWEQITGDAYLKIVTENAGTLGGTSSEHKIPLSSIPSHHHSVERVAQYGNSGATANFQSGNAWNGYSELGTSYTGGGQAYYPYYLGVYVWKRTA